MAEWIRVASLEDCPPGCTLEAMAGERVVAILNVDGTFHALDGICPHQGGPLGKGRLEGHVLTCPWHGWQFDGRDGRHCSIASVAQPTLPVRVEEGAVWVDVATDS